MISQDPLQKILGISEKVELEPEAMAMTMKFTCIPFLKDDSDPLLVDAFNKLKDKLEKFGAQYIDYTQSFEKVPLKKRVQRLFKLFLNNILYILRKSLFIKQKSFYLDLQTIGKLVSKFRYKKGIAIFAIGEIDSNDLPMQRITSFKSNSIISIVPFPENVSTESTFESHFDTAMNLFAFHMANIVIAIKENQWMIYNFNASHPIFNPNQEQDLDYYILHGLIPKIVAPISPYKLEEFIIKKERFSPADKKHTGSIEDILFGSHAFSKTNLFPKGKKIDDLPFRKNFHKHIGKLHLDNRSGMSFGFLAHQLPAQLRKVETTTMTEGKEEGIRFFTGSDNRIHIEFNLNNSTHSFEIPSVEVMTLRSGADKTNIDLQKDFLKMGISDGQMFIELPENLKIDNSYKPSFDTKVILAHAVGNSIIATISKHLSLNKRFVEQITSYGFGIAHWHGYFNSHLIPQGIFEFGRLNPHVACSSPQSAIYALEGKLTNFFKVLADGNEFLGDIHVEPHHGSNVCYTSLKELSDYITNHPDSVALGNKYL